MLQRVNCQKEINNLFLRAEYVLFLYRVKLKLQKDDPNFGEMRRNKESSLFFPEQNRKIYQIFCYLAMKTEIK